MVPLNILDVGDQGQIVKIEKGSCESNNKSKKVCECHKDMHPSDEIQMPVKGFHNKKATPQHKPELYCRIEELGLRVGKQISILQKGKRGPMLVKVDETRIALGQGMASRILIENS